MQFSVAQNPNLTETKIFVGGNSYSSTAVGDINGDGNLDVVITKRTIGAVEIYYGDGNFNFPNTQSINVMPNVSLSIRSVEIIDWDLDGDLDLLLANLGNTSSRGVHLITNMGLNANNPFNISTSVSHILTGTSIIDIAVGDFTGNSIPELAVCQDLGTFSVSDRFIIYESVNGALSSIFTKTTIGNPNGLKFVDTDNDGDLDVVFSDFQNNRIRRFKNVGTNTPSETGFNIDKPVESAFADLNGDNIPDHIYITSQGGFQLPKLFYRLTNTDGSLTVDTIISNFNDDSNGFGVAASDFDGDGDIDIVANDYINTSNNINPVKYFENIGTPTSPTFVERTVPFTGDKSGLRRILVADFDNDGNDDFLVEDRSSILGQFIIYHDDTLPNTLSINSPNIMLSVDVYPNPVKDILNIRSTDQITDVKVYDIQGKLIKVKFVTNSIDVSNLKSGVYFLQVTSEKGSVAKRFIKQ